MEIQEIADNEIVDDLLNKLRVRKLNKIEYEKFSQAATNAVSIVPAFRDAIALLRPFFDPTSHIAYVDPFSRVGLGNWFFNLNPKQRSSVLLHECMHVLNNHFVRGENLGAKNNLMNIAGDFEINCSLNKLPQADVSFGIMPNKGEFNYPINLTLEQYIHLLKEDNYSPPEQTKSGDGEASGSAGSGENDSEGDFSSRADSPCGSSTDERIKAADEAEVERASDTEQTIAKKNTAVRMADDLKKARQAGNSHLTNFLEVTLNQMRPPKVKWQHIFRRIFAKSEDNIISGRQDYTYQRVNRRMTDSEFIFPGMIQYSPTLMFGIDTSGSMMEDDKLSALSEVEAIMKTATKSRTPLKVFSVDTEISKVSLARKVKDVKLEGGGGTDMSVAFQYVNSLPVKKQPDIFVLATDGGTHWGSVEREIKSRKRRYTPIILVTHKPGYDSVPNSLHKLAKVIDISNK